MDSFTWKSDELSKDVENIWKPTELLEVENQWEPTKLSEEVTNPSILLENDEDTCQTLLEDLGKLHFKCYESHCMAIVDENNLFCNQHEPHNQLGCPFAYALFMGYPEPNIIRIKEADMKPSLVNNHFDTRFYLANEVRQLRKSSTFLIQEIHGMIEEVQKMESKSNNIIMKVQEIYSRSTIVAELGSFRKSSTFLIRDFREILNELLSMEHDSNKIMKKLQEIN